MPKEDINFNPKQLRPNYKISSSTGDPVYTSPVFTSSQPSYSIDITNANYAAQGLLYTLSTPALVVQNKNYLAVKFTNPSSSAKSVYLMQASGYYTIKGSENVNYIRVDIYANAAVSAASASLTAYNTNLGVSTTSVCTAYYVNQSAVPVSGTSAGTFIDSNGTSFFCDFDGGYLIPKGNTFTIQIYNNTNGQNIISTNLEWLEK